MQLSRASLALVLIVLAACGKGDPGADGTQDPTLTAPSSSVTGSVAPNSPGAGASSPGTDPGGAGATPSPTPTRPDHVEGTRKAKLIITMGEVCVERGDTQTLTIRSDPGLSYSFGTLWPDGEAHPEWAAVGLGTIPPGGTVVHSWVIPRDAPRGDARTDVSVAGKYNGEDSTRFGNRRWKIAADC